MSETFNEPVSQILVVETIIVQNDVKIVLPNCLVDTGSEITLIKSKNAKKLKKVKNDKKITIVNCANQNIASFEEMVLVSMTFENTNISKISIGVIPENINIKFDLIIGLDSLTGRTLQIHENRVQINNFAILTSQHKSIEILSLKHEFCNFSCHEDCMKNKCEHEIFPFENQIHILNSESFFIPPKMVKKIEIFSDKPIEKQDSVKFNTTWKLHNILNLCDVIWIENEPAELVFENLSSETVYVEKLNPVVCVERQKWSQKVELNHIRAISDLPPEEADFHRAEYIEWYKKRENLVKNHKISEQITKLVKMSKFRKIELKICLENNSWVFNQYTTVSIA